MPASKSNLPVKRTGTSSNEYLEELHQAIVQANKDAESAAALFWRSLSLAHKAGVAMDRGHRTTVDYLVTEFSLDRRSSQHHVRMVEVWDKLKLDTDLVNKIGPTVCREIAIYLDRSNATPKVAKALIEKVQKEGLTCRQVQDYSSNQLEDGSTAKNGKGQRRDREPRKSWTLSATETDKRAILDVLPELEDITGTSDPVENMRLACVELANSRSENPEDAIEFATQQIGTVQKRLDQVVSSIMSLQSSGTARDSKTADRLMGNVMHVVIRSLAAVSNYVSPDAEIDAKTVFRVATGGKPKLQPQYQQNFANICLMLARVCGAPDKLVAQLEKSISSPDLIEG